MPTISFPRFQAEVLEIYGLKAPATLALMKQVLREIGELKGVLKVSDLKPVTIARWLKAHPERSTANRDKLLRSLSAACSIGIASGYLKGSPIAALGKLPDVDCDDDDEGPKLRHHSMAEVKRVLELATAEAAAYPLEWKPARLEALVFTYAFAALRKREALHLRRADLDLDEGIIHIRKRVAGKAVKTRASAAPVPMPPALVEVLRPWSTRCGSPWLFPGVTLKGPWTGGPPGHKPLDQVKALGQRAGVEGLTILSFRHSFGTHSRRWGLSDLMLKAILRHTTLRTQKHYIHADPEDLRHAAGAVTY